MLHGITFTDASGQLCPPDVSPLTPGLLPLKKENAGAGYADLDVIALLMKQRECPGSRNTTRADAAKLVELQQKIFEKPSGPVRAHIIPLGRTLSGN